MVADTAPAALGGPPPPRPAAARAGWLHPLLGALLLAGAAGLLQWLVQPWLGGRLPFVFVLPAVVLAAALWGRGPGVLVLGLGMLSSVPTLLLPATSVLPGGRLLVPLALLAGVGALLVALGARLRELRHRARAAEARLVLAIEGTGMGVFEVDLAAQRVHLSPGLARRVNLPDEPVPLPHWLQRIPPETLAVVEAELHAQLRRHAGSYEQTLHLQPGAPGVAGVEWLLLRMQIDWAGGQPRQLRGVCLDITARKGAEDALAQARSALEQQVADLNALHQLSSNLLEVDALEDQLGVILHTLAQCHGSARGAMVLLQDEGPRLGLAATTGLDGDSLQQLRSAIAGPDATRLASRLGQRVVVQDTQGLPVAGHWRALAQMEGLRAVHSTPLVSRGGTLLGAVVIGLDQPRQPTERERRLADICARKASVFIERARAQAALAESKDRFQAVLESSVVPFTVLAPVRDAQGRVDDFSWRYVNSAAAQALGQDAGTLVGQRVLSSLQARTSTRIDLQPYIDVVQHGQARQFEIRLRLDGQDGRDERDGWVQCIASPLHDEVAVWFTDITDRKRSEQLLRDADRRKDEFLATLAHELRNPLAPIRQAALLWKAPNATDAQRRWSHEVIERQVQHMAALLDDLLDVSRITRGVMVLRRDEVWLASVIDAAVETARPLVEARQHRLTVELPPQPVQLNADPLRLAQVVGNLLSNAAKYTDAQGDIRLVCQLDDKGLCITISDNGIGIPGDWLAKVFDMFTQLPHAGERAQGGLGIGLALSRGLVTLHGGTITAHSDGPGQGSTFSVHLPRGTVVLPTHAGAPGSPPCDAQQAPVQGLRMLVADDNRDAAGSLAMLLQLQGHEVHQAFDGEQALAEYKRLSPQVCLLDIGMPVRDGYSLARAIRSLGGPRPVLVAVTGWGQAHDRQRALAAGFDHHLTKPVDLTQLMQLITQPVL